MFYSKGTIFHKKPSAKQSNFHDIVDLKKVILKKDKHEDKYLGEFLILEGEVITEKGVILKPGNSVILNPNSFNPDFDKIYKDVDFSRGFNYVLYQLEYNTETYSVF